MEYVTIIARTLFLYALIVIIFRLMGKREVGELSILDLVVFIMIAESAVAGIESPDKPVIESVLPMLLLMIIQISLATVSLKSKKIRDLLDGEPSMLIENGKINEEQMKKQRYNFDDLLTQLRDKNVNNLADVEFAILEPTGKLSVFEKDHKKRSTLHLPLIIDGSVQENHLKILDKTNFWLRQQLRDLGYRNIKEISYCSYDNGVFYIDLIDKKK
ncbi:uncharacterized membrane protein YcaP (DUF421 family) [Bacillus mesophilus]|uniref:DUF421 domain-containing protein n=1 Tax=Bacillus mesophilus TaxID=1808955 RepID=A0A6M0Q641_9BACI|nr:DUF421 domain-containing protein [Bacillus mesophilus]MBM7660689.1 uncharacterized membrane protein YcaP (DUF421 family) [Bacillus mesophilus]NEY71764.1 DUF421 domain-containing protein [Bacillus mesophilus]